MPVYVFRCQSCGEEFSVMTSWRKKSEVVCPHCGAGRLQEQWGAYKVAAAGTGTESPGVCGCGVPLAGGG